MRLAIWIIIAIFLLAGIFYIACYFFVRKTLKKFMHAVEPGNLGLDYGEEFERMQQRAAEWYSQNPEEMVSVRSRDGLKLVGHWWDREKDRTVIFIHGYSNTGSQATLVAPVFMDILEANVLAPDCRGHGESDGEWIGFGWPDRFDVLTWVRYLIDRLGPDHEIILFGLSMGGATVLCAAGEELPENVQVIVSDCGYSSLSDLFKNIIHKSMHLPPQPFLFLIDHFFKKWFGYSVYDVQPVSQVQRARVPILFIHGEIDQFIPSLMCKELYDACSTEKQLLIVPGARHALSAVIDWDRYCSTLKYFCDLHAQRRIHQHVNG